MKIIYVHHALRDVGNPPTHDDKIKPIGISNAITATRLNAYAKFLRLKRSFNGLSFFFTSNFIPLFIAIFSKNT